MHLGHLFLVISLLGLGSIGILLKLSDYLKCRASAVTASLFLWAGLFLSIYLLLIHKSSLLLKMPGKLFVVSILCGFCASLAILSFQTGLRHGKISTSWVIINLSTILPTILSILIYREAVNPAKVVALLLVVIAILLLWKDKKLDEAAHNAESHASILDGRAETTPEGNE